MGKNSGARRQARAQEQAAQINAQSALDVAQLQYDATLQAAGITAGASSYAAGLQFELGNNSLEEQRRQFDATTENLAPYLQAGEQFLPEILKASTAEGFAERLAQITDTDVFADLQSDRLQAASSQLGQSGLTRSGAAAQAASDITTDLALGLDATLYGRQANAVNIGQAAAARQSNAGQNFANSVTGINQNTANNVGQIVTSGAAQQAGFINQGAYYLGQGQSGAASARANGLIGSANAYAQGQQNQFNNLLAGGSAIASLFFSDERLKDNMVKVGEVDNLSLYEWDWKEGAKKIIGTEMNIGFKASEVKRKHPDCVIDIGGYKAINYPKLQDKLKSKMRVAA